MSSYMKFFRNKCNEIIYCRIYDRDISSFAFAFGFEFQITPLTNKLNNVEIKKC